MNKRYIVCQLERNGNEIFSDSTYMFVGYDYWLPFNTKEEAEQKVEEILKKHPKLLLTIIEVFHTEKF